MKLRIVFFMYAIHKVFDSTTYFSHQKYMWYTPQIILATEGYLINTSGINILSNQMPILLEEHIIYTQLFVGWHKWLNHSCIYLHETYNPQLWLGLYISCIQTHSLFAYNNVMFILMNGHTKCRINSHMVTQEYTRSDMYSYMVTQEVICIVIWSHKKWHV